MEYWAIDAGGTRTTARVGDTRYTRGSVNPASAGAAAEATLARLLAEIAADLAGAPALGWFASAAITMDTVPAEIDRLAVLAREHGLAGRLVVSGDVPPLLLAPPTAGRGWSWWPGPGRPAWRVPGRTRGRRW
ncbi:hypothetical protein [Embleya scabrispora]|uniref:hypothetical protein n=1 Tax=Embleya scabrispora TaxID=159449 RepID=UPI001374DA80|nr:hypothetical protein [Embleya scabrispora]